MADLVMVIEDEKEIRDLVRYNLERAGFRVAVAADGEEGLERVFASRPDAVVLDLMLPGRTGLEVLRELRAEPMTRDVPVIVLTARAAEMDKLLGFEHGADDYLTKPFSPRELVARVQALLRRARPAGGPQAVEAGPLRVDPGHARGLVPRPAAGPHAARVRPARVPGAPPRTRALPRGVAAQGLGLRLRGRHPHGGRPRAPPAGEAGQGRAPDRDGPGLRLQAGRAGRGPLSAVMDLSQRARLVAGHVLVVVVALALMTALEARRQREWVAQRTGVELERAARQVGGRPRRPRRPGGGRGAPRGRRWATASRSWTAPGVCSATPRCRPADWRRWRTTPTARRSRRRCAAAPGGRCGTAAPSAWTWSTSRCRGRGGAGGGRAPGRAVARRARPGPLAAAAARWCRRRWRCC